MHYAEIEINKYNVYDLLMAASQFGLQHLENVCIEYYIGKRDSKDNFLLPTGTVSLDNLSSDRRCIDKMSDLWTIISSTVFQKYSSVVKQWLFGKWVDEERTIPNTRRVKVNSAFLKCEAPILSYQLLKDVVLKTDYVHNLGVEKTIAEEISDWENYIPNEDVYAYLIGEWYKFQLETVKADKATIDQQIKVLAHMINWMVVTDQCMKKFCENVPILKSEVESIKNSKPNPEYVPVPREYSHIYTCPELPYYDHAMANWQYVLKKEQFCGYKLLGDIKRVQIYFPCRERDYTKMINTFYIMPNLEEIVLYGNMSDEECNDLVEVLRNDDLLSLTTINCQNEETLSATSIKALEGLKGSAHCPKLSKIVPRS